MSEQRQLTDETQPADQADNLFNPTSYGHRIRGRFDDQAKTRALSINPAVLRITVLAVIVTVVAAAAVITVGLLASL